MNFQKSLINISDLISSFVLRIKSDNAMGLLDINRLSEDVLVPIFTEVYDYSGLINLNKHGENYPGLDLGDDKSKVAFQVSSDASSTKIKEALETFVKYGHYKKYNHLIIYIITEKQGSYLGSGWDAIIKGRFTFSKNDDIRDYADLLQAIRHLSLEKVQKIEAILERHFSEVQRVSTGVLIKNHLQRQLAKEKKSKKYIPDIFIEVSKIKDNARFFAHPTLFLQKVKDDVDRLSFGNINRVLRKLSLTPIELPPDATGASDATILNVQEKIKSLSEILHNIHNTIHPYSYRGAEMQGSIVVPSEKNYIYESGKYFLASMTSTVLWSLDDLIANLELMSARVLFIVSRAGQGKTNFVCNFAETVLAKRDIPCVFFTGREFNHVVPAKIGEYFTKSIFGDSVDSTDDALSHLSNLATEADAPAIIIIDGINEHKNIQAFSHHLEKFVEQILSYGNIKVVLTCRSEYFEERFHNFKQSSFSDEIKIIDTLERCMKEMHRGQMVKGYLRFFHLRSSYISGRATKILENDTLLLRMFCEAYGSTTTEQEIQLPQVVDIYREKVFREYLDRKINSAAECAEDEARIRVRPGDSYHKTLNHIIQLMIQRNQYADISITDFPKEFDFSLGVLLGEDIIIRKDLMGNDSAFGERIEVINFTFDEFRDFLLAKYLVVNTFRQDRRQFEKVVDRAIAPESPIAEGVGTYLFFAARHPNGRDILSVISKKDWYRDIFIKSIFSVEEEFITQDDFKEIKTRFLENTRNASWIIRMLVWRWRTNWYPRLNIQLLFEIFTELDEDMYNKLVKPIIRDGGVWGFDGAPSWTIGHLTNELNKMLEDDVLKNDYDFKNLMEVLIFFFPILTVRSFSSLAFDTYANYARINPAAAITLLRKYLRINHSGIRADIWRMLNRIAQINEITDEVVEEACLLIIPPVEDSAEESIPESREIAIFLETMATKKLIHFNDAVMKQIKRHVPFTVTRNKNI